MAHPPLEVDEDEECGALCLLLSPSLPRLGTLLQRHSPSLHHWPAAKAFFQDLPGIIKTAVDLRGNLMQAELPSPACGRPPLWPSSLPLRYPTLVALAQQAPSVLVKSKQPAPTWSNPTSQQTTTSVAVTGCDERVSRSV
ncbi:hypothetical protein VZT92_014595 [Zoarces viviparus]|uniref:Uncharacterized protein n=1 Tax=Zoarces viviparus TaxID=48416 RepID=A0AAW1F163_ZOAVI